MLGSDKRVSRLLTEVVAWAKGQRAIVGVALVGSHARHEARPDSDIDIILLSSEHQPYVRDSSWTSVFGEIASCLEEDWSPITSLRAFYRNGLEVEFSLTPLVWTTLWDDRETQKVVLDGMKILYDPDGLLASFQDAVLKTRRW